MAAQAAQATQWFALRYGALARHFLNLVASGPARSGVAVRDADLTIVMGRSFSGHSSRAAVVSAHTLTGTVLGRGVRGWRGDWIVSGAGDGIVELRFEPPMKARVLSLPVSIERLRISIEDPAGFVAALAAGTGP